MQEMKFPVGREPAQSLEEGGKGGAVKNWKNDDWRGESHEQQKSNGVERAQWPDLANLTTVVTEFRLGPSSDQKLLYGFNKRGIWSDSHLKNKQTTTTKERKTKKMTAPRLPIQSGILKTHWVFPSSPTPRQGQLHNIQGLTNLEDAELSSKATKYC